MKKTGTFVMHLLLTWMLLGSLCKAFGAQTENWFCTEESGRRNDHVFWACGVGDGFTESDARKDALNHAVEEFNTLCELSSDCKGQKRVVEPKRLSCVSVRHGEGASFTKRGITEWKCYRLIEFRLATSEG